MTFEEERAAVDACMSPLDRAIALRDAWESACERADRVTEQLRVVHDRMVRLERAMIDAVKTLDIL